MQTIHLTRTLNIFFTIDRVRKPRFAEMRFHILVVRDMDNTVDIKNNKFTFDNRDIPVIFDGNKKPWFHANTIAEILGYVRPRKAVSDHVDESYKTTYSDIKEFDTHKSYTGRPDSVFIDDPGVCCLLGGAKCKRNGFKDWVFKELLPHLRERDVTSLKTENEVFRQMIDKTQIQQMFGILEREDNEKTDNKNEYKFVDTQKRYFTKAIDDSSEYDLCFKTEYIIIDGECITKKVLREIEKDGVKHEYNNKSKCITIYDDDFNLINLVKKTMREVMLWQKK
jgi:prophage antirepressor-like protein